MNVGAFSLSPAVMVAPMAGVTDLPFRETVHDFGRVWVEGEMVSANPDLLESNESERKIAFGDEPSPRIVQLLGAVPAWMNRAASFVEECGADIIDINMGCPAKSKDFVGRGGAAERVSFAACGETNDTQLATTRQEAFSGRTAAESKMEGTHEK